VSNGKHSTVPADDLPDLSKWGWDYFVQKSGKTRAKYDADKKRLGIRGFTQLLALAKESGNPEPAKSAKALFCVAVDRMMADPFYNGNKDGLARAEWASLFNRRKFNGKALVEYWLEDANFPAEKHRVN
jgi:hypothetical protein